MNKKWSGLVLLWSLLAACNLSAPTPAPVQFSEPVAARLLDPRLQGIDQQRFAEVLGLLPPEFRENISYIDAQG